MHYVSAAFQLVQIKALVLCGQHPKIAGMMRSHLISNRLNSVFYTNEQPCAMNSRQHLLCPTCV